MWIRLLAVIMLMAFALTLSTCGRKQNILPGLPAPVTVGPDFDIDPSATSQSIQFSRESFGPDSCAILEGCLATPGSRRLMRFTTTIRNIGTSQFFLGSPVGNPAFEYSACHDHYHLSEITSYELLTADTRSPVLVDQRRIVGRKQGFCMMDTEDFKNSTAPAVYDCDNQGISAGWADVYDSSLDCQWLDITGVAPGRYILHLSVNPLGAYQETNRSNNDVDIPVEIPPE